MVSETLWWSLKGKEKAPADLEAGYRAKKQDPSAGLLKISAIFAVPIGISNLT